jgi:hypothetical protein
MCYVASTGHDESTLHCRTTMLWYGTPAQTALLSDNVLPTVPASRLAHHYVATGEHTYQRTAAYEYLVHTPLTAATGTAMVYRIFALGVYKKGTALWRAYAGSALTVKAAVIDAP